MEPTGDVIVKVGKKVLGTIVIKHALPSHFTNENVAKTLRDFRTCACCGHPVGTFSSVTPFMFCIDTDVATVTNGTVDVIETFQRGGCDYLTKGSCTAIDKKEGRCRGRLDSKWFKEFMDVAYRGSFSRYFLDTMKLYLAVLFAPVFGVTRVKIAIAVKRGTKWNTRRLLLQYCDIMTNDLEIVKACAPFFLAYLCVHEGFMKRNGWWLRKNASPSDLASVFFIIKAIFASKLISVRVDPVETLKNYIAHIFLKTSTLCTGCHRLISFRSERCKRCGTEQDRSE